MLFFYINTWKVNWKGNDIIRNSIIRNITIYSLAAGGSVHGTGVYAEKGIMEGCLIEECKAYQAEGSMTNPYKGKSRSSLIIGNKYKTINHY